jgi:hypothetical protein
VLYQDECLLLSFAAWELSLCTDQTFGSQVSRIVQCIAEINNSVNKAITLPDHFLLFRDKFLCHIPTSDMFCPIACPQYVIVPNTSLAFYLCIPYHLRCYTEAPSTRSTFLSNEAIHKDSGIFAEPSLTQFFTPSYCPQRRN